MLNHQHRILYIDDDVTLVRLIQKAATRRGYEFVHAANAEEGIALLEQGNIDVIALDHHLPTGTGLELLSSLNKRNHAPPVVYVTGSAEMSVAVSALKAGASDYVAKTVSEDFSELFFSAIEQALVRARLTREKDRAEQEVREARDRAELLLSEVNHRVGNSLSLVAALVRMQMTTVTDPAAIDALAETQARIIAIAGVHRRLYTSNNVGSVNADEYLAALVEELDTTMRSAGHTAVVRLQADHMMINTDKAVSLGVAVTELVTNAFKYAYETCAFGEIRVRLVRAAESTAVLVVEDDGIGWNGEGAAKGTGLGSKIIKAMATTLGSRIQYETMTPGTRASLEFHL